jgi:hypothetical protein
MENKKSKKINLRKSNIGKNFIVFLSKVGYSKESINKAFQSKLNPSVKDALKWEKKYNIPVNAWIDVKAYLLLLIKEEEIKAQTKTKEEGEQNTFSTEKASA